ncbi:MAG: hypothetical protein ACK56A_11520 [Bacteroidota bacterium]
MSTLKKISLLPLLVILSMQYHPLNAQVTLFKKSVLDSLQERRLYGVGGLSFLYNNDGQAELFALADASFLYATKKHTFEWLSSLNYNSTDQVASTNRFHSMLRAGLFRNNHEANSNLLKKKRLFAEPFVFFQWDEKRGISQRWQIGANAVYAFRSDSGNLKWNLGAGVVYEQEDWRVFSREKQLIFDTLPPAFKELVRTILGLDTRGHLIRDNWRMNFYSNLWFEHRSLSLNLFLGLQQPFRAPFEGLPDIPFYPYPKKKFPRVTADLSFSYRISRYISLITRYYMQLDKGQLTQFVPDYVYTFTQGISVAF